MGPNLPPDISICMVSLNCWHVLEKCLDSLEASVASSTYEIIIVDNASSDNTVQKVKNFGSQKVHLIQNDRNLGFTKATNQGIKISTGRNILWLNTDTILKPGALHELCVFLDSNPQAGIVGPKVLNSNGTFQPQCRRGAPTPWTALSHMMRLDNIFPRHTSISKYLLSSLPENKRAEVDAVSGCCLMTRRCVWNNVGLLDEDYFGFGEDLDWCLRAKKAGWKVWYHPESVIVHLKGQGGVHAKPYHKLWGIHQAMWIYYEKHLRYNYHFIIRIFVFTAIKASFLFQGTVMFIRRTCTNKFAQVKRAYKTVFARIRT